MKSKSFTNIALLLAALFVGCAEDRQGPVRPPVPPSRPTIEGNVKSVSPADIQLVLELKRKEMIAGDHHEWPIYSLRVVDRNHITIHYLFGDSEAWAYAERVNGKWKLSNTERIMVTGSNIPVP